MKKVLIVALLLSTPALAQQQHDPMFLQRALTAMQTQRNQAQDVAAEREAQLMNELAKAQARIKELEQKPKE